MTNSLKIKIMAPPNTTGTDWTILGIIWGLCLTALAIIFKWIDAHFAARKTDRESFIKAVVNEVLTSNLQSVKDDIKTLFQYHNEDRNHYDTKFDNLMKEIKK